MTVPELIANVLDNLRRSFYSDGIGGIRIREFKRDERQLIKAIATYGYECNQRGWFFQADFIYQDLMKLLLQIRTSDAAIEYLPVYLAGAIRRHIGFRAEELSAKAKALPAHISKLLNIAHQIANMPCEKKPSDVEVFTEVYRGIGKIQRARRRVKKAFAQERQVTLL